MRVSHLGMRGLAIGGYSLRGDSKGICQIGIVKLRQGFIFDEVFVVLMLLFQLKVGFLLVFYQKLMLLFSFFVFFFN